MDHIIQDQHIEWLAQLLIEDCCIDGIRNAGGRYTKVWPPEKLQKRLAKRLREILKTDGRLRTVVQP